MSDIALAILWHQHQPYYPDDITGDNPMPWVRLHGVKDYYGMALHLLEYPAMRCTINLVPSLLVQLEAYTERGGSDQFLQVSRVPADGLSESDCLFLLDHFFMANHEHMIRPFPRYAELLQRRAFDRHSAAEVLRRFTPRDFRDLQVWFNLTWIHPLAWARHAGLTELLQKGRHFTENEKEHVLTTHLEILRQIIPLHRQLADSGQVELTTTPFYHPILPLLLDKKLAREALPDIKLPRFQGSYPEDAAVQLRRAITKHAEVFGRRPQGLWPAEGSVCQAMIPLLAEHGLRWMASDEGILMRSTHGFVSRDSKGHVHNPDRMYQPYRVAEQGHELSIVFRDRLLSDMIGFHYQRSEPVAAADDFVRHLHAIGRAVDRAGEPALVSVILDGENCWEHYPGGGVTFLRTLYDRCTRTKDIQPVTIGQFLEKHPPRDVLPRLFAGSWINHSFAIWIGHEEDNTAWDALHRTREYLRQREQDEERQASKRAERMARTDVSPDKTTGARSLLQGERSALVQRAWEEIYIAEGSDWFWWYGDDHRSLQDGLFDYLFRKHLQNVYLLLGDPPPSDLSRPIMWRRQRVVHSSPRLFLNVKIDGRQTFFEWINAGHYPCRHERGTMALGGAGPLRDIYFGFDLQTLLIRVDCTGNAREVLTPYELRIGFLEPAGYDLRITPPRAHRPLSFQLYRHEEPVDHGGVQVALGTIVEVAIPFARLGVAENQLVQFYVELREGGQSRDRAPPEGGIAFACPSPDFEHIMWDV